MPFGNFLGDFVDKMQKKLVLQLLFLTFRITSKESTIIQILQNPKQIEK